MTQHTAGDLLALDRAHLWHPYSSMTAPAPVRLVESAQGVRLRLRRTATAESVEVIDAMSSWWSAVHGYGVAELDRAASEQLSRMSHVMFGGLTHAPAIELAERLVDLTPEPLQHVFLADSGSVSVEVALKMAFQATGRRRLLTVRGGYHGDTFGAMSVCDPVGGMHTMFAGVLTEHLFADQPPRPEAEPTELATWSADVRALAAAHADEIAAIVVEPILQGAGGMHDYDAACLTVLRALADEVGALLIFDEIATGFGRTGTFFAGEAAGVTPDLLCVGKALTGGYLTLAAVLATSEVAAALSASASGVLMHGPTFMGNPLACAVASASLDLLQTRGWRTDVGRLAVGLETGLKPARDLPGVRDVRTLGGVGVIQLDHDVDVTAATEAALDAGVWIRPFRDLIYAMPPYISTESDLEQITAAMVLAAGVG